jgi:hypothetical protein
VILPQRSQTVETLGLAQPSRDFEVVLHVGHPKTASTWLQETIFANPESGFVFPGGKDDSRARMISAFLTVNSFCDDVAWARGFFEGGLQQCAGKPEVPIISDESLCGDPLLRINNYSGRYMADRIHAVFPRAKILIGVREQKALALSLYREYLMLGGLHPLEVFIGRGDEPLGFTPILYREYLEFDRVVGYYQALYGGTNVLVLPMEQLQRDKESYIRSILEFCRCPGRIERLAEPMRVGQSALALTARRYMNPFAQPDPLSPRWGLGRRVVEKLGRAIDRLAPRSWSARLERRWKAMVARRYTGMFRNSNHRLAELTGIDLAALGYEC